MLASAQQGDWPTVDGACRAALLLLSPSADKAVATPAQALSALRPILAELPAEGLGPPAGLVAQLARRGAPERPVRATTQALWKRAAEVVETSANQLKTCTNNYY